jgi:DUF4097 and DUF4098 domain-containing protein YvlB
MKHTFHTPQPLRILIRNPAGQVELTCLDTTQTEVVVEPAGRDGIELAEQTTVAQDGDQLRIEVPEKRWGRAPKILVRVSAPAGSELDARTASADVECVGMLSGLTFSGASGDVLAELVEGDAAVQMASGDVRLGTVVGGTRVRTASGDVTAARLGTLDVTTASGDVTVGTLGGELLAKTASGDVQVADASAGTVEATTASGDITVAVRRGTAVHLELSTVSGAVRSELPVDDGQPQGGAGLQLRLRSISGDVLVRRAGVARQAQNAAW